MKSVLVFTVILSATSAFAGKAEREYMSTEVDPAVKAATAAFKKGCGCDLKFNVKTDGFTEKDHMKNIRDWAQEISGNAPEYCKDAASKKAMCTLKTMNVSFGSADLKYKGGVATVTLGKDMGSIPSWAMLTGEVDK